jgi:hypothetical protein
MVLFGQMNGGVNVNFIDANHITRYNTLIQRDGTHEKDLERRSMFYLFSGVEDLYNKIKHLYDFTAQVIMPETFENGATDLTSSMRSLVRVAYNLYNGFPADVRDTFAPLDETNRQLVLEALKIRFRINDKE